MRGGYALEHGCDDTVGREVFAGHVVGRNAVLIRVPLNSFQSGSGLLKRVECDQSIAAGDVAAPGRVLHDSWTSRRQVATGAATEPTTFAGDVNVFGDAPLAGALGNEASIGRPGLGRRRERR